MPTLPPVRDGQVNDRFLGRPSKRHWLRGRESGEWIVCFGGEDWWYHSHGHFDIQLMKRFSRTVKVLYVCSIGMRMPSLRRDRLFLTRLIRKTRSVMHWLRRVRDNLYVLSALPLPFYRSRIGRLVNAMVIRTQLRLVYWQLKIRSPIVWVNTPTAWPVAATLTRVGVVYQRTDDYAAYDFDNFDAEYVKQIDTELVRDADLVIHVSDELHEEAAKLTENSVLVTQGVDERFFRKEGPIPQDLQAIHRPIVGYIGGMDRYKFSTDLVEAVARRLPHVSFVLVGQRNPNAERLAELPNVYFLGMKDHAAVPAYVRGFDVCIVPTARTSWGLKCRPLKLMEYLAAEKPVVATETPASRAFANAITVAQDQESWVEGIIAALRGSSACAGAASKAAAALDSWDDLAVRFWQELRGKGLAASRMTPQPRQPGSAAEVGK